MRTVNVSIGDFLQANQRATVIQLIPYLLQGGQSGYKLLSTIAACQRLFFDSPDDIQYIGGSYLVWYKPNQKGEANWNRAGCKNYTVAEYVNCILGGSVSRPDINTLVSLLKGGLSQDVVLVVAFDTELDKRVIVDGCKRAVALALIARQSLGEFVKLLNSSFSITVMELKSRLAHVLYPCDFFNSCP